MSSEQKVASWLSGDPGLQEAALASASAPYEPFHNFRFWVTNLLYDFGYGVFADDLQWVSDRGGDVEAAKKIRDEMTKLEFDVLNWDEVARLVREGKI